MINCLLRWYYSLFQLTLHLLDFFTFHLGMINCMLSLFYSLFQLTLHLLDLCYLSFRYDQLLAEVILFIVSVDSSFVGDMCSFHLGMIICSLSRFYSLFQLTVHFFQPCVLSFRYDQFLLRWSYSLFQLTVHLLETCVLLFGYAHFLAEVILYAVSIDGSFIGDMCPFI